MKGNILKIRDGGKESHSTTNKSSCYVGWGSLFLRASPEANQYAAKFSVLLRYKTHTAERFLQWEQNCWIGKWHISTSQCDSTAIVVLQCRGVSGGERVLWVHQMLRCLSSFENIVLNEVIWCTIYFLNYFLLTNICYLTIRAQTQIVKILFLKRGAMQPQSEQWKGYWTPCIGSLPSPEVTFPKVSSEVD